MDQDIQTQDQQLPKSNLKRYPGAKGIPLEAIIDYRRKNLSCSQIATLLHCHPSNISRRLKDADEEINLTNAFEKSRAFIFRNEQRKIIQSITPADRKKAGLLEKVKATTFLHNAERTDEGKPTNITGYVDMIKARQILNEEKEAITAELIKSGVDLPVYNSDPEAVHNQETNVTP